MRKYIKYGVLILIFVFSFIAFSPRVNANYGENEYGDYLYSFTDTSSILSSGTTKEYRDKFLAEQEAKKVSISQSANTNTNTVTTTPTTNTVTSSKIIRTLKQGMTGDDVKELQLYLNTNGHDSGVADGMFGSKTKGAVIGFQKANNLSADGIAGPKTLEVMNISTQVPSTPSGTFTASRTLKQGMTGEDVKALQMYLGSNGYGCDCGVDGIFGPKTKAAVILFQNSNSLVADGIVGLKTLQLIK